MHPAELSKRLSKLVQRDFLSRSGRASATRYQLTGDEDGVGTDDYSEHSTPNTVQSPDISKHCSEIGDCERNSHTANAIANTKEVPDSEHSTPNTVQSPDSNKHGSEFANAEHAVSAYYAEAEGLPDSVRKEIQEFLGRSYNKKKQTEDMILAICRGRWITLPVLSQLLERHPVALRTRYLQPMIGAGKLRRKHESPNHRDQAYMMVE